MNHSAAAMMPRKSLLILLVIVLALLLGTLQQQKLSVARAVLVQTRKQQALLEGHHAEAATALETARHQLHELRTSHDQTLAAARQAEAALAQVDPESRWADPPANASAWQADSPYIWLRKTLLPELPITVFRENGELDPDVATVLCADPAVCRALDDKLTHLLTEYHGLEAANAERIDEPLPGISGDGRQVTVQVKPLTEQETQLKQQFKAALLDALGQQRADFLANRDGWFDSRNSEFASEAKTYSVVRHPDGTYNLSVKSGGGWFSTSGFKDLSRYVPAHLLPLFSDVVGPAPAADSPAPGQ